MSVHAEEEMSNDDLTIFDVEHCILTGEIAERQRDLNTGEWKYLVKGVSITGANIHTVTKISVTGKLVFITVFAHL